MNGLVTRYMGAGLPHLRQVSGLPQGLLPDFTVVARELGDEGMLKLAEPLGLAKRIEALLAQAPDPDSLPVEIWQQGIANWQPAHQVLSVTMALLRACEKVDALRQQGALKVDFALIRGLAVIAYAPFVPKGSELLSRLANTLGGGVTEPARLLEHYTTAVVTGDSDILADVDRCILENPEWWEWSERLLNTGKDFPLFPRAIGITPPLSSALKQILVNMLMEAINAHSSRNNPN